MKARTFFSALLFLMACGDDAAPADDTSSTMDATPDVSEDGVATDAESDGSTDAEEDVSADIPEIDAGPELVEALVLTGHLGRRMMSCDRGETFLYDISVDDSLRCWNMDGGEGPDCDHHPTSNNGAAFGMGMFVATAGWGAVTETEGGLFLSDGSMDWSQQEMPSITFNGVSFGNGTFIANAGRPAVSRDGGATWTRTPDENLYFGPSRGAFFADVMGGVHVMLRDSLADTWFTNDDGMTFFQASDTGGCGINGGMGGAGGGDTLLLYSTRDDIGCTSTDGGQTWTSGSFPENASSRVVWTGSEFFTFGRDVRYRSTDGMSWTEDATTGGPGGPGLMARAEDGTLFAVQSSWGSYYSNANLWTSSDDGATWTQASASLNGHPLRGIALGQVPASICE